VSTPRNQSMRGTECQALFGILRTRAGALAIAASCILALYVAALLAAPRPSQGASPNLVRIAFLGLFAASVLGSIGAGVTCVLVRRRCPAIVPWQCLSASATALSAAAAFAAWGTRWWPAIGLQVAAAMAFLLLHRLVPRAIPCPNQSGPSATPTPVAEWLGPAVGGGVAVASLLFLCLGLFGVVPAIIAVVCGVLAGPVVGIGLVVIVYRARRARQQDVAPDRRPRL
jgi:hypothetical protein